MEWKEVVVGDTTTPAAVSAAVSTAASAVPTIESVAAVEAVHLPAQVATSASTEQADFDRSGRRIGDGHPSSIARSSRDESVTKIGDGSGLSDMDTANQFAVLEALRNRLQSVLQSEESVRASIDSKRRSLAALRNRIFDLVLGEAMLPQPSLTPPSGTGGGAPGGVGVGSNETSRNSRSAFASHANERTVAAAAQLKNSMCLRDLAADLVPLFGPAAAASATSTSTSTSGSSSSAAAAVAAARASKFGGVDFKRDAPSSPSVRGVVETDACDPPVAVLGLQLLDCSVSVVPGTWTILVYARLLNSSRCVCVDGQMEHCEKCDSTDDNNEKKEEEMMMTIIFSAWTPL